MSNEDEAKSVPEGDDMGRSEGEDTGKSEGEGKSHLTVEQVRRMMKLRPVARVVEQERVSTPSTPGPMSITGAPSSHHATVTIPESQLHALQIDYDNYVRLNREINALALFLREEYSWEIESHQPQHSGDLSTCIIHYLRIERRRWKVRVRNLFRAVESFGRRG